MYVHYYKEFKECNKWHMKEQTSYGAFFIFSNLYLDSCKNSNMCIMELALKRS